MKSKKIFIILSLLAISLILIAPAVFAQDPLGMNSANNIGLPNSSSADPREVAVNVVRYLMTFLGIIAVVVILIGGFKWMVAGGNDDKIAEAKKMLIAGIIGLIIIISAYAIVQVIVSTTINTLSAT